jgi:hypothetical protein
VKKVVDVDDVDDEDDDDNADSIESVIKRKTKKLQAKKNKKSEKFTIDFEYESEKASFESIDDDDCFFFCLVSARVTSKIVVDETAPTKEVSTTQEVKNDDEMMTVTSVIESMDQVNDYKTIAEFTAVRDCSLFSIFHFFFGEFIVMYLI